MLSHGSKVVWISFLALSLLAVILVFNSRAGADQEEKVLKIMPLGDSWTHDENGSGAYRRLLYKLLKKAKVK